MHVDRPRAIDVVAQQTVGSRCKRNADEHTENAKRSPADGNRCKHPDSRQLDGRTDNVRIDKVALELLQHDDKDEEYERLDPSVRDFEPKMALVGGADGLDFYRAIVKNFSSALKPGGFLCFEFGMGQHDAVREILEQHRYNVLQMREDTGNIIRAVLAQYKGEET